MEDYAIGLFGFPFAHGKWLKICQIIQKNQKNQNFDVDLSMIDLPQADATDSKDCFEIEAIISFDERGQLVFPKDVRKKFDLKAGEKFMMVSCTNEKGLCCFTLVKTSAVNGLLGKSLGPMINKLG